MLKKSMSVVFVLSLFLITPVHSETIVWVSEWLTNPQGLSFDYEWIDLLEADGHTVIADTTINHMALDAAKLATLEEADLIILSRTSNSGNYADNAAEITQWNSIETPLILMNAYLTRSNRWQWTDSTAITEFQAEAMLSVVDTSHQVFTGVSPVNGQIDMIDGSVNSGQVTFINTSDIGNETLIAQRADDSSVWIAEWEAGVEFYSGTTEVPAEKRMLFTSGGSAAQESGTLNLTEDGQKIFINAVRYMLGLSTQLGSATNPKPSNDSVDILRDVILSWTPGEYADKHDVYLGTSFDDVNLAMPTDAVYLGRVDSNSYPDSGTIRLGFDQTYYWRVDEINAPPDSTVFKGEIWSFTTEPFSIWIPGELITATASSNTPDQGPEKTIDSSGLDANDLHSSASSAMWLTVMGEPVPAWIQYEFDKAYQLNEMLVWNYNAESILAGLGLRDVTIEYSIDGSAWTQLDGAFEFQQAPGAAGYASDISVDFADIAARFVKITAANNWLPAFPQYGLSEVRFMTIPVSAREPSPADEATDVAVDAALSWRAGREAAEHKVSLSTDLQAVIDGTAPVTTVSQTSYSPALDLGSTFFWQIEEVNNAETPTTWQSDIWNFATQEYIVVDDFESYNDIPEGEEGSNLVYITWEDGYANPATNGSTMGYVTGESMETGNVYGGEQSAPLFYNNTSASSSEVTVDLGKLPIGRNWSKGSPQALVLWIHGDPGNTGNDRLYVKIGNSKFPYDGDIARPQWKPVVVDLTGVNLNNVSSLTIGIERSGGSGGSGIVFIDDIVLAATAPAVPSEEVWIEAESADSIQAPMMTFDDPNASGGQYIMKDPDVEPSYDSPPADGLVTYQFTVAGGTYTIAGRVITDGMNDGLWFRIPEATMNVEGDPSNPGWIEWNGMTSEDVWGWDDVFSSNNDNVTVEFTLDAGTYTIEIRYRDDATQLDALVIARID